MRRKEQVTLRPGTLLTALAGTALAAPAAFAAITPTYQVTDADATWAHQGNGIYTVPTNAEDYDNEIWERPIQDGEWSDAGGTRTSGTDNGGGSGDGKYWAYGDLASASWGIGTSMDMDYLFVRWVVVGDFEHVSGKASSEGPVGLKGHYYFYARPDGGEAFAIEVNDPSGFGSTFGSNPGKVTIFADPDNDVSGPGGVTATEETIDGKGDGSLSFDNGSVNGQVRASGFTVEVAVKLSDLDLTPADFNTAADWAYAGVAVSNPSAANTDLFANDRYEEAAGSGQEYDTVLLGTLVPEPGSLALLGLGGLALLRRRR